MSNLQSARDALQAELSQAKAGMAYYQSRAETLEKTLSQLAGLNVSDESKKPRKGMHAPVLRGGKQKRTAGTRLARRTAGAAATTDQSRSEASSGELPFTGGDYWTNLLSDQPQSGPDILKAAISKLTFAPTKDQIQKLAGRMTFALNTMVKEKKIQDSDSGRARRFFKA